MAKTSLAVCVIFANPGDAVRTLPRLTQADAFRGRTGENLDSHGIGFPSHPHFSGTSLPKAGFTPNYPIASNPPASSSSKESFKDDINQSVEKALFSPSPTWKKDATTFVLDEADDAFGAAKRHRVEETAFEASTKSAPLVATNPQLHEEASRIEPLATYTDVSALSFNSRTINSALEHTLSAHRSLQRALRKDVVGQAKDQDIDAETSLREAVTRAFEVNADLRQNPAIWKACAAVLDRMRKDLKGAHAYELTGSYNEIMVTLSFKRAHLLEVLDRFQELGDHLVALADENTDLSSLAYESLHEECVEIFGRMRQSLDVAHSYEITTGQREVLVTLSQQRVHLQQALDQLKILEGKIAPLTAQKNDLTLWLHECLNEGFATISKKLRGHIGVAQSFETVRSHDRAVPSLIMICADLIQILDDLQDLEAKVGLLFDERIINLYEEFERTVEVYESLKPTPLGDTIKKRRREKEP